MWFKADIKINFESLTDYLRLGYIPAPAALFKNSWMLKPGSFLTINAELNAHLQLYHKIDDKCEHIESDHATAKEKFIIYLR